MCVTKRAGPIATQVKKNIDLENKTNKNKIAGELLPKILLYKNSIKLWYQYNLKIKIIKI